jgi:signal transduction histidine kinase
VRFLIGSAIGLIVVAAVGFYALRAVALDEASRDTGERVSTIGNLVQSAGLVQGVIDHDPLVIARLNRIVPNAIVRGSVVRVKIWRADGTILYADEPSLIGQRFPLDDEEVGILEQGGTDVELSDLTKAENARERLDDHRLIEAYTQVVAPNGDKVLLEIYQRYSSVGELRDRIFAQLVPPLAFALLLVALIQIPLVRRLVRNLGEAADDRERLRTHAVDSSRAERLRIAADLSAGAVDVLTPVPDRLSELASDADGAERTAEAAELRFLADSVERSLRQLRGDLADILPPDLEEHGLDGALHRLLSPLAADGVHTELDAHPLGSSRLDELAYRIAREGIRNAERHAHPRSITVRIGRDEAHGVARIVVQDDGGGFTTGEREEAEHAGRRGLRLTEDLVRDAGGSLAVRSEPDEGTAIEATFPLA